MCLLEKSAIYRPKLIGWRDTAARFIHDLATNGMPMSLASLKASCDSVAADRRVRDKRGTPTGRSFRLIRSIGALIGVPAASRA